MGGGGEGEERTSLTLQNRASVGVCLASACVPIPGRDKICYYNIMQALNTEVKNKNKQKAKKAKTNELQTNLFGYPTVTINTINPLCKPTVHSLCKSHADKTPIRCLKYSVHFLT